jgi:hypothetical protein
VVAAFVHEKRTYPVPKKADHATVTAAIWTATAQATA